MNPSVMLLLCLCTIPLNVYAVEYVVGGTLGWTNPAFVKRSSDLYKSWADKTTFHEGDTLLFNYTKGLHNVEVVSKQNYDACRNTSNDVHTDGKNKIKLDRTGTWYFMCGYPGHCDAGQAFAANVEAAAPTTSVAPSSATVASLSAPLLLALFIFLLSAFLCRSSCW